MYFGPDSFGGSGSAPRHDQLLRQSGKAAFVAHNRIDDPIECTVRPGPGFTFLGAFETPISVVPGASLRVPIQP